MVILDRATIPHYSIPENLKKVLNNKAYKDNKQCKIFRDIVNQLKNIDILKLSELHYFQFLKFGLYLEEYQERIDIKVFDLYKQKIKNIKIKEKKKNTCTTYKMTKKFKINIPDLDKEHPAFNYKSLNLYDCLNNKKYYMDIKYLSIKNHFIIVTSEEKFLTVFEPNNLYNIKFIFNNYSFRCSHYAISLIKSCDKWLDILFPHEFTNIDHNIVFKKCNWLNKNILKDPDQKQVVVNIINNTSFPAPYILYGPPGTGKTATLVEVISQIWHQNLGKILICTPSNNAADLITKRLLDYIPQEHILRIYNSAMLSFTNLIDEELKNCYCYASNLESSLSKARKNNKSLDIMVATLCTSSRLFLLNELSFSYLFIDEAGQAIEPECLIPLTIMVKNYYKKCQVILSGDPKQLGPVLKSKHAVPILGQSMLERMIQLEPYTKNVNNEYNARYITQLKRNYRSHASIIYTSNKLFYDNTLISCHSEKNISFINNKFSSKFPIIFHGVNGREERISQSTSCCNHAEIQQVLKYVKLIIGKKIGSKIIDNKDIGIVTPFTLQSKYLQKELKKKNLYSVEVGPVEIFQGQEKEVIIFSTVRSRTFSQKERVHIGFLSNPKRFNVALTRAKSILIIIGNPKALKVDENWRYLMKYCTDNNACYGTKFDLLIENKCTKQTIIANSINLFPNHKHLLSQDGDL